MQQFLKRTKTIMVNLSELTSFRIVLGNESCDLDSAICALTYAYFLNHKIGMEVLPIFNILKAEMPLKTEVVYYLKQNNISIDDLIYRDSLDLTVLKNLPLEITLVDHHTMSRPWIQLVSKVTEILDHRPKDAKWNWGANVQDVIQMVGSCATLVTKLVFCNEQNIENKDLSVLAKPLHATIILDTVNFSKTAARATELDSEMIILLERIINVPASEVQSFRSQIFEELVKARTDVSSLTTKQILLKDMKMAGRVPISGMPILIEKFLKIPLSEEAILEFCDELGTNIVILMGMQIDGEFVTRDIGLFSKNGTDDVKEIASALLNCKEPELILKEKKSPLKDLILFSQGNTKATRKHVYPILKNVIEKL